jgi:hypothetical protein
MKEYHSRFLKKLARGPNASLICHSLRVWGVKRGFVPVQLHTHA